jgi:Na+/melibiose symporter-like transporter
MRSQRSTTRSWRREVLIFAACLLAAFAINAGAILYYDTRWIELVSQAGWMLAIALALYLVSALVRLLSRGLRRLLRA